MTLSKLKKRRQSVRSVDLWIHHYHLHPGTTSFHQKQRGEAEMSFIPPPSLIAVAFSTITPKATGDGGVVKEWEGHFTSIMEVERPVS